ncbi:uncharacterized protein BKA78DRAFT_357451 [Phyllosticta capitalensis]|uniref:uncharacterized protein n=1 Tax=Phyllosticta capitalensis TaxID=121624 RepID=UPI00312EF580
MANVQELTLILDIEPSFSYSYKPNNKGFIKEPISINYPSSGSMQDAKLHRSDQSASPTTYWGVKGYGFHNDTSLPQLLHADRVSTWPNHRNSTFGKALADLLVALGEHDKVKALTLRLQMPDRIPGYEVSGLHEFIRPFELLCGIENLKFCVYGCRGGEARQALEAELERISRLLNTRRDKCKGRLETICTCMECFLTLEESGARTDQKYTEQEDWFDEGIAMEKEIAKVESYKEYLAERDAYNDPWDKDTSWDGPRVWEDDRAYEIMFRPGANSFSSGKMTDFSPAGTMTSAENTEETSAPDLAGARPCNSPITGQSFSFLALPRELRDIVYDDVIVIACEFLSGIQKDATVALSSSRPNLAVPSRPPASSLSPSTHRGNDMASPPDQQAAPTVAGDSIGEPAVMKEKPTHLASTFLRGTPREIRDMVYEEVLKEDFSEGIFGAAPAGVWSLKAFLRAAEGNLVGFEPPVLPALLAVCKQTKKEYQERMHARLRFWLSNYAHGTLSCIGLPKKIRYINIEDIQNLSLDIFIEPAYEIMFQPGPNVLLAEPVSDGILSKARLSRSKETLSPTTYFDVKKYGVYNSSGLPQIFGAQEVATLPTRHNSDFGRALADFIVELGNRDKIRSLDLRVVLQTWNGPTGCRVHCIHTSSGVNEFLRPFTILSGIKDLKIRLKGPKYRDALCAGVEVQHMLRTEVENLRFQMGSGGRNCVHTLDRICNCEKCFPTLSKLKHQVIEPDQDNKLDNKALQQQLVEVENHKHRLAEDEYHDGLISDHEATYPMGRQEHALASSSGFRIGISEHRPHDGCDCHACWLEQSQW